MHRAAAEGVLDREEVGGVRVRPQVRFDHSSVDDRPNAVRRENRQQVDVILLGTVEPRHEEHHRQRRCRGLSGERGEAATRGIDADGRDTVRRLISALVA
jgi:hypothetical protein